MKENVAEHLNILPFLWKNGMGVSTGKLQVSIVSLWIQNSIVFCVAELTCFLLYD